MVRNDAQRNPFYVHKEEREYTLSPVLPVDSNVKIFSKLGKFLLPYEYSGWLEETMSWKETCYIHAGLTLLLSQTTIKGRDAERFLSENSTVDFSKAKVGQAKHTLLCNKYGNVMGHGVVLKLDRNRFDTYGFEENLLYLNEKKSYEIEAINPTYNDFIFQIGGPTSLQTIENATQENFHNLEFMHFRESSIAGKKVRILRMGVAGTLAYEVHGQIEDGLAIYNTLLVAGKDFGMKKIGETYSSYMCNHTENGYPQNYNHFYSAFREDEGFYKWYRENIKPEVPNQHDPWDQGNGMEEMRGTLGGTISDYYRNPIELGWEKTIDWDHEFVGKEALIKIVNNNPRKPVTLFWNAEDVLDVYASYLREENEPYLFMPWPKGEGEADFQLKVINAKGDCIGVTSYRTYTLYQRKNISLCCLEPAYANFGEEVTILWGDRDKHPIKKIRATVGEFPSLNLPRNKEYDTNLIPNLK